MEITFNLGKSDNKNRDNLKEVQQRNHNGVMGREGQGEESYARWGWSVKASKD